MEAVTLFVLVDLDGSESGFEVVEKDENGDRNGQNEANQEEDDDGLSKK